MMHSDVEKRLIGVLRDADCFDIVCSQIWKHHEDFGSMPSMILVAKSLWRPLVLQVAERLEIPATSLVLGPITINEVPIIFVPLQDPTSYLQMHGSKPSEVWSL